MARKAAQRRLTGAEAIEQLRALQRKLDFNRAAITLGLLQRDAHNRAQMEGVECPHAPRCFFCNKAEFDAFIWEMVERHEAAAQGAE